MDEHNSEWQIKYNTANQAVHKFQVYMKYVNHGWDLWDLIKEVEM